MRVLLFLLLLLLPASAAPAPRIRVALAVDAPHARVNAARWSVKTRDGMRVLFRAEGDLRIHQGPIVNGTSLPDGALLVPSDGFFRYDGRTWRGWLEVLPGLVLVDHVDLEQYLAGVLGGELAPHWPLETQKAQAVAARTYALYQKGRTVDDDGAPRDPRWDVWPSVRDQVYPGVQGESAASRAAVAATRGQVLSLGEGKPLKAYYSSSCGGHTSDSVPVFGTRVPALLGVPDPYCGGGSAWSHEFAVETLRAKAAPALKAVAALGPTGHDRSGRIAGFRLADVSGAEVVVSGHRLRMLLGPAVMRSTRARMAVVARDGSGRPLRVRFSGTGWGHGVGLCQWGAEGMGQQGFGYREILAHYYLEAAIIP